MIHLTSHGKSCFNRASARPPQGITTTFVSCSRRVYCNTSGQYWTLPCLGDSSNITAYYTISVRRLETLPGKVNRFPLPSGFLQIPPRGGHPCLRLTLPTTKRVVDFHHQVVAHAGRTIKRASANKSRSPFAILAINQIEIKLYPIEVMFCTC